MSVPTITFRRTFSAITNLISSWFDDNFTDINTWITETCGAANGIATLDANARLPFAQAAPQKGSVAYNNASTTGSIQWSTNSYDTDSIHSTSVNTDRFTVPSGVSKVRVIVQLNSAGAVTFQIYKNGATFIGTVQGSLNNETKSAKTASVAVSAGDYFTLNVSVGNLSSDATGLINWMALEIVE